MEDKFTRGKVDTTLFYKIFKNDSLVVQIYVNDIIFSYVNATLCKEFAKSTHAEFEMSLMGELKLFLGIQINQSTKGTYIHQGKYTIELLKKFNMYDCKPAKTLMHPTCIL